MNEDKKSMLKDARNLFLITLIAGLILGAAYYVTKEPIAAEKAAEEQAACKNVFSEAESFKDLEDFSSEDAAASVKDTYPKDDITEVKTALDASGNVLGYVMVVTSHEGYGGDIEFSMGITADGYLNGISLLSISETAGLGMRAGEVLVPQFKDKKVTTFEYTKTGAAADNQIDAISGATITTKAITNGVNAGILYFQNELEGGSSQ